MIAVPVTLCPPVVNTLDNPTVAALATVKLPSLFPETAELPTTPPTLTDPPPAVSVNPCVVLLSTVALKLMLPPAVVIATVPVSVTGPVTEKFAAAPVFWIVDPKPAAPFTVSPFAFRLMTPAECVRLCATTMAAAIAKVPDPVTLRSK